MTDQGQAGWEGELFRLLVENVRDHALFVVDAEGRVRSWNPGAERLLGYAEGEIVGQSADRFFTPEDIRAGVPQQERQMALEAGRGEDDRWHVRKDGSCFWSSSVMTPLRDEGGALRGFARIMRDRTDLKRAEEELARRTRESDQRRRLYEAALSNTPDLVYVFDLDHRFTYANEGLLALWGRTWEEAIGKNCLELGCEPCHAAMHDREIEQVVATKQPIKGEVPFTGTSGRRLYEYIFVPVIGEQGEVEAVAGTTRDVTDRRQAEEALRESEERFRGLMEQAPFSVQVFAPDGRTLRVNRAWEELWGTTLDQLAAYNILQDPQFETRGIAPYLQRAFAGEPVEIPAIQYDPTETIPGLTRHQDPRRWVAAVAYPLKDTGGRVREVVLVHQDITARRRAEERLRFLAEASSVLASSLDYEATLRSVAELVVPALADWCAVDVLLEDQSLRRVAVVHPDPAKVELGHELLHRYPLRLDMPEGAVMRSGQPVLHGEITDAMLSTFARDAEHLAILRRLNLKSTMVVPLSARGGILGAISLVSDESGRRYGPDDLALAEELARRAALAVENARLYRTAQDALRQREESLALLDTLQQNAPVGFAFVDRQFRYVRINEALAAINGKTPADHLGLTVQASVPELWHQLEPLYRGVLASGLPVTDQEVTGETPAAPGRIRHWLVNYYPVRIHEEIAGIGILVAEITERKRLENELRQRAEQLQESEQRFARFMQHLPGLAWIKDLQGRYLYANDAAEKAFRTRREALYGKTDEEVFPPETARQFKDNDRRACSSGTGVQVVETLEHEDGTVRHSLVSKFPIVGLDGEPSLVGGMAIDITDRMRAEEALKAADRLKDEFLAMLAHELRNPLAPVRNALHIMKQPGADGALLREMRDMAERQVQHMARLLDDLLDVSRISRGRIELRKEAVDVAAVISRTVEAVRPLIEERRHELTMSLPAGPLRVEADPTRLEQVLTNLLNNAAKYTDPGGHVWLTAERAGGEVVVRVRDTGLGIAPDLLPRIFDLFVQAERQLDRSQGGVGIGLTLVRKLVELHGGRIEATSAGLGQGSEFVVRLPALPDQRPGEQARAAGKDAAPELPRRHVLVVDDNQDAADSLAMLLRLAGQDVRAAYDGPSALTQAQDFQPAMVFLDIGMPGMDGYEVARRLRRQPGLENARLVAVTGWGQEEDRRRSKEAGFDHHMVKPVEPAALEKLLAGLRNRP